MCGDFNQPQEWAKAQSLEVAPEEPESTYPSADSSEPIDYVVANALRIFGRSIGGCPASDHLPIMVEETLPGETK